MSYCITLLPALVTAISTTERPTDNKSIAVTQQNSIKAAEWCALATAYRPAVDAAFATPIDAAIRPAISKANAIPK